MAKKVFIKSPGPHIHQGESVPKIYWTLTLSLFPVLLFALLFHGTSALRAITISVSMMLIYEYGLRMALNQPLRIYDGNSVYLALIYVLWLPVATPAFPIAIGAAVLFFFAKAVFGGLGSYPFQPAFLSLLVLHYLLPGLFDSGTAEYGQAAGLLLQTRDAFAAWLPPQVLALLGFRGITFLEVGALAFVPGVVLIGVRRWIAWSWVLCFCVVWGLLSVSWPAYPISVRDLPALLCLLFFVMAEPGMLPMMRPARRVSGALTALAVYALGGSLPLVYASVLGALLVQAFHPWLDHALRPRQSRLWRDMNLKQKSHLLNV